jgi:hypothetical protein
MLVIGVQACLNMKAKIIKIIGGKGSGRYMMTWKNISVSSLMARTGRVLDTLVYSPFNHPMQLLAPKNIIEFSHHKRF